MLGRADAVTAELRAAGWRVVSVGAADDLPGFYREIAAALDFPAYFGANLDALWDCLRDVEAPTALVLPAWRRLAVHDPRSWRRVLGVLTRRAETPPAFVVVLPG